MVKPWEQDWSVDDAGVGAGGGSAKPWEQDWSVEGQVRAPEKKRSFADDIAEFGLDFGKRAAGAVVSGVASIPLGIEKGVKSLVRSSVEASGDSMLPAGIYNPGIDTDEAIHGPETARDKDARLLAAERAASAVPNLPGARTLAKAGREGREAIHATTSEATQRAVADSQISGNIFKGEIDFGSDPSVRGYVMQAADVFGSMLPVIAGSLVTRRPGVGGAIGGGMAAGEGAESAAEFIAGRTDDQLLEESPFFARLVNGGASFEEARRLTADKASESAALLQGAVASVGDRFTGKLVTGKLDPVLARAAGNSVLGRAAAGGALSAAEEGLQEVGEGVASDIGVTSVVPSKEIGEDSAANLVLGALGGGPAGVGRGAYSGVRERISGGGQDVADQTQAGAGGQAAEAAGGQDAPAAGSDAAATTGVSDAGRATTPVQAPGVDGVDGESAQLFAERERLIDSVVSGEEVPTEQEAAVADVAQEEPLQEVAAVRGAPAVIATADGAQAEGQYALVEADDLVTDRDQYGRENAAYAIARDPSMVPDRHSREMAVSGISQKLDLSRLGVADTDEAGAPVVDADGQVVAGNARAQALRRIYVPSDGDGPQAYGSKAFDYRSWLQQEAPAVGIDPAQVAAMRKPVLVRIRSTPSARVSGDQASTEQEVEGGAAVTGDQPAALAEAAASPVQVVEWEAFAPDSGSLGIPRAEMPQIKAEHRGALVQYLRGKGIEHGAEEDVDPATLKPTQAEFSPAKVAKAKGSDGGRSILVSADDHVLDGHHQWRAALEKGEPIKVIRFAAPMAELLPAALDFPSAVQVEGAGGAAEARLSRADDGAGQEDAGRISYDELKALADRLKAGMPNMPRVHVLADPSQAPKPLRAYIIRQDAWYDVEGAMHDGELYLFASGLADAERAEHVLIEHEAAHYGLRAVLGPSLKTAMRLVYMQNGKVRKAVTEMQKRGRLSDVAATEEVIVDIPTAELSKLRGWRRVVAMARDWLAERGYQTLAQKLTDWIDGSLTEQDRADLFVAELVRAARDHVAGRRKADSPVGAGTALSGNVADEVTQQDRWLRHEAQARGYKDIDDLVARNYPLFERLAELGRQKGKGDIALSRGVHTLMGLPEVPQETKFQASRRVAQDRFHRFRLINEWAKKNGTDLSDLSDVYRAEERMHGRIATRVEDFREKRVKPLVERIQKAGYSMDQVAEFLHAQHAKERNLQIQKIDPALKDGSGMTTQQARAILNNAQPRLAKLANEFRAITDDTRKLLLDSGIITQEMADAWTAAYKHYVPLKGGDEDGRQAGTGAGLSVKNTNKRALGHKARQEFIIENIMRDYERAVMLSEKNRVGQSLLAMVVELGRSDIATFGKPERRKVLRNTTEYEVKGDGGGVMGSFASLEAATQFMSDFMSTNPGAKLKVSKVRGDPVAAYMASPMLGDNEVQIYAKGHTVRIQLHDPILLRAYKNLGSDHLNRLMRLNREINAGLSKAYTAYNPEFFSRNVLRDFTSGLINITGRDGARIAAKAAMNYPRAFAQMFRYSWTNGDQMSESIRLYRESGGSTGAAYLSDIERIGKEVTAAFENYQGAMNLARSGKLGAAARAAFRRLIRLMTRWLEVFNEAGENAMRVAVFDAVRTTRGRTIEDAASAAKNATVNFNRRGEIGSTLSSLYLFANPAIQGTAITLETLLTSKHRNQARVLTGLMVGLAYSLASMGFGGEGDDDEWERIPPDVKDRNLIIRTGETSYVTLSVPYGYGFAHMLGNALFDLQRGADLDKVSFRLASGFLTHFGVGVNPFNGDEPEAAGFIELIPGLFGGELMRATVRMAANRSGLGSDIVPETGFDEGKPDNLKMFRSTKGSLYEAATTKLNELTGGSASQSGALDFSPETLKYWVQTLTGGAGKFMADAFSAALLYGKAALEEDEDFANSLLPAKRDIPVVRTMSRDEDVRDYRRVFWEKVREVEEAQKNWRRALKLEDDEAADSIDEKLGYLLDLASYAKSARDAAKSERDYIDEINADDSLSLGEKRKLVAEVEEEEKAIYQAFVEEFQTTKRESGKARLRPPGEAVESLKPAPP